MWIKRGWIFFFEINCDVFDSVIWSRFFVRTEIGLFCCFFQYFVAINRLFSTKWSIYANQNSIDLISISAHRMFEYFQNNMNNEVMLSSIFATWIIFNDKKIKYRHLFAYSISFNAHRYINGRLLFISRNQCASLIPFISILVPFFTCSIEYWMLHLFGFLEFDNIKFEFIA